MPRSLAMTIGKALPRPGPRRPLVAVRLTTEEITAVDHLAEQRGVSRSDVIRDAIQREVAVSRLTPGDARRLAVELLTAAENVDEREGK
jgi:metal-responsive CopG/Arc/MetJ family transcriptional regulator